MFPDDHPLLTGPPFGVPQADKEPLMLEAMARLVEHHRQRCAGYARILEVFGGAPPQTLEQVPWLPVGLFKSHLLHSVPDAEVTTILTSSGTSDQAPSRIVLDRHTARRQAEALAKIMGEVLGPRRLPMLIIDHPEVLRDRAAVSARAAGVLGMMNLGARPVFALDGGMNLDREAVRQFLARHGGDRFLIFGFTFMVWQHLAEVVAAGELDLSHGVLVHSGGWKKLLERAVDNATFKAELGRRTGLSKIYSFYGMAEQVGSVFLEGDDGFLYPPAFAEVIVRDAMTLAPAPIGAVGLIEVMSLLPTSYPGHALLTEDLGVIHHVDGGARRGKAFSVLGRLPRAELRGCSDTYATRREAR